MSDPEDYYVGWICAIETEYVAAKVFLDEVHDGPKHISPSDNNDYTLGRMGNHNVVIAVLPDGEYGTTSAASVGRDMLHSFSNIRIGLMVGIAGGAPSAHHDIRLGDVVVSTAKNGKGGVIQYDFGKQVQGLKLQLTGFLNQPPTLLRTAVVGLKSQYQVDGHQIHASISGILERHPRLQEGFARPGKSADLLFRSDFIHPTDSETKCADFCGRKLSGLKARPDRDEKSDDPMIHYGLIASANQLMKDAITRDQLAEEGVLCFEMEAAGLMNHFPALVIRGICDYADTHKNKQWQGYAALTAAAYAKDLLTRIPPSRVEAEKRSRDILTDLERNFGSFVADHETQDILDWLSPANESLQQREFLRRRQEGTGEWLLKSTELKKWSEKRGQTLFCPGNPGTGKTIATSIVVEHLQKTHGHAAPGIAYLYLDFQKRKDQQTMDLFMSLLKQLIRAPVPQVVKSLYLDHKLRKTHPSFEEIVNALHEVALEYPRVFILVDALDECEDSLKLISELSKLQTKTDASIFATSRFIPDITRKFEKCLSIEIKATSEDIQRYLLETIPRKLRPSLLEDGSLQADIINGATHISDGVFLLAKLYLDFLANATTQKAAKTALARFQDITKASDVGDFDNAFDYAYEDVMRRIESQPDGLQRLAKQVLSWITCAMRSLSPLELQHALAVEPDAHYLDEANMPTCEDMVTSCAGLVTVDEANNIIRLTHHTAQEYFERTRGVWFPGAQDNITKTCVAYLSFNRFQGASADSLFQDNLKTFLDANALYSYASQNWGHHARMSSIDGSNSILRLLESNQNVDSGSRTMIYILDTRTPRAKELQAFNSFKFSAVQLAAYFGLENSMSLLLSKQMKSGIRYNIRVKLSDWTRRGKRHDAQALRSNGLWSQVYQSQDRIGDRPLVLAAENGHENIVKILLEHGLKPKPDDKKLKGTALAAAASRGYLKVVKLLLENGDKINHRGRGGRTPLMQAARSGHRDVVKLLLDEFAEVNLIDDENRTAISYAAEGGHDAVVELLLDDDAQIETRGEATQTPLAWAAKRGFKSTVELLLDKGARVHSEDKAGRTPLSWSAEGGHADIVELLLDEGADIESPDKVGRTTLFWAAGRGHEKLVRILLANGCNRDARDPAGFTPLLWAARDGHEGVVKLLIQDGLTNGIDSSLGNTYLCTAENMGQEMLVKELLSRCVDLETRDYFGRTPLIRAAETRRYALVRFVISRGAVLEARDDADRTAFWWTVKNQNQEIIKFLLDKGADLNHCDKSGQSPLLLASKAHDVEIFRLLLTNGAFPDVEDTDGQTPLMWTIMYGDEDLVRLLVDKNVNLEKEDTKYGRTALLWAARKRHPRIVTLLLDNGAMLEAEDHEGQTALSLAAKHGFQDVVSILLGRGADMENIDYQLRTPAAWAAMGGHGSVTDLFENAALSNCNSMALVD